MKTQFAGIILGLAAFPLAAFNVACGCGPNGETGSELAPLVFASNRTLELPARIRVRNGGPRVEAQITNCRSSALSGATIQFFDINGVAMGPSASMCAATTFLEAAPETDVDLRVVVTLPAGAPSGVTGEIELTTFSDVCASVGRSELVSFGT